MFSPKLVTTRSEMIKKSLKEFLVSSVRLKTWLDVFSLISTLIRFSMVVYQLFEKKFAVSMENEGLPVSCESTLTAIFIMTFYYVCRTLKIQGTLLKTLEVHQFVARNLENELPFSGNLLYLKDDLATHYRDLISQKFCNHEGLVRCLFILLIWGPNTSKVSCEIVVRLN